MYQQKDTIHNLVVVFFLLFLLVVLLSLIESYKLTAKHYIPQMQPACHGYSSILSVVTCPSLWSTLCRGGTCTIRSGNIVWRSSRRQPPALFELNLHGGEGHGEDGFLQDFQSSNGHALHGCIRATCES